MNLSTLMAGVFAPLPEKKKAAVAESVAVTNPEPQRIDRNDPHLQKCMELIYKNVSKRF